MANMEKIIRPHLPANIAPEDTSAKNRSAPKNVVAKFPQTTSDTSSVGIGGVNVQDPSDSYTYRTSQSSYYKKCYMRKREKETSDT